MNPPPFDALIETMRSLFETQSDFEDDEAAAFADGELEQLVDVQTSQSLGARQLPQRRLAMRDGRKPCNGTALVVRKGDKPSSAAAGAAPAPLWKRRTNGSASKSVTRERASAVLGNSRSGCSRPTAPSSAESKGDVQELRLPIACKQGVQSAWDHLVPEQLPERCLSADTPSSQSSDQTLGTVKLHLEASEAKKGSATSTLRDAHVVFEERQFVVRAVDRSGRTWTFRSPLPGPIVTDECRFKVSKTGQELNISLKKADENEEWRVKDRICWDEAKEENLAVLSLKAGAHADEDAKRCDAIVKPLKDKVASDAAKVCQLNSGKDACRGGLVGGKDLGKLFI